MEAKQVVDKILDDAKKEAQKIKEQAEEDAKKQEQGFANELQDYEAETKSLADEAAKTRKQRLLASARMDLAKEKLSEKRKVLDEVFKQASKEFREMPDDEYREVISNLILKAVETGDEEVIMDKGESRIDQEFIKEVNRKLGPGYQGNLRLSEEKDDLEASVILKRGKVKTNLSLKVLLAQAKEELEIELANLLFRDSKQ